MTDRTSRYHLRTLLSEVFSVDEFCRFLADYPDTSVVVPLLPSRSAPQIDVLDEGVGALLRHGLVTPSFFERLGSVRPHCMHEIRRMQALYFPETTAPLPMTCVSAHIEHPLQSARTLRGRGTDLLDVEHWLKHAKSSPDILTIVAPGGTGKTALVEAAVRDLCRPPSTLEGGLFIWSFYVNPSPDKFLRTLATYSCSAQPDTDAPINTLCRVEATTKTTVVLDGFETVQSSTGIRPRGSIWHDDLRRFVKLCAQSTRPFRLLITSRFPLIDLADTPTSQHKTIRLLDLDLEATMEVLRDQGVNNVGPICREVARLTGGHALSVAVTGGFMMAFPDQVNQEDITNLLATSDDMDPKSYRLTRILEAYVSALTSVERCILQLVTIIPSGVTIGTIEALRRLPDDPTGLPADIGRPQVVSSAERLTAIGLLQHVHHHGSRRWTAHPFVRATAARVISERNRRLHQAVAATQRATLDQAPALLPFNCEQLMQLEEVVFHLRMAGLTTEAIDLWETRSGGFHHVVGALGQSDLGFRVAHAFLSSFSVDQDSRHVSGPRRLALQETVLYGMLAGRLDSAENAARELAENLGNGQFNGSPEAIANLGDCLLKQGRLPESEKMFQLALSEMRRSFDPTHRPFCMIKLSQIRHHLGDDDGAQRLIDDLWQRSAEIEWSEWYMEVFRLRELGHLEDALELGRKEFVRASENEWPMFRVRFAIQLAQLEHARGSDWSKYAEIVEDWLSHADDVEDWLLWREFEVLKDIRVGSFERALSLAEEGVAASKAGSWNLMTIRLLGLQATIRKMMGATAAAREVARQAIKLAQRDDIKYGRWERRLQRLIDPTLWGYSSFEE